MTPPRILVAGIGNIFLGDDAFGCETVKRLVRRSIPDNVRVVDYGIRGFDLVYALLDDYEAFILVDAVPKGDTPGTLYTIDVDTSELGDNGDGDMMVDTHGMNPVKVLAMAKAMGANPKRVLVVGCEPAPWEGEEEEQERMGLSEPVEAALDEACAMIESLISTITREKGEQHEQLIEGPGDHRRGSGNLRCGA